MWRLSSEDSNEEGEDGDVIEEDGDTMESLYNERTDKEDGDVEE